MIPTDVSKLAFAFFGAPPVLRLVPGDTIDKSAGVVTVRDVRGWAVYRFTYDDFDFLIRSDWS